MRTDVRRHGLGQAHGVLEEYGRLDKREIHGVTASSYKDPGLSSLLAQGKS